MSTREKTAVDESLMMPTNKLTTPFDLERHLSPPKMNLDLVPVLDLIVLALMISLLFTRYLMIPGVRVDLPKVELSIQQDASRVAVLTIANSGMLFFAGNVFEQNSIRQGFQQYFDNSKSESPVLLVKAEASMDIQQFLELCKMAQDAGFGEVQIAADPKVTEQTLNAESLSNQNNNVIFPVR
jgi:biopolymer transport protein ExbD